MQIYLFKKFLSKGIGVWKKIPSWSNLASFEVQIVKLCLPKCLNIIILQKYLSIVYLCHQIVFKFQIWFWQARRYIAFSIKESWITVFSENCPLNLKKNKKKYNKTEKSFSSLGCQINDQSYWFTLKPNLWKYVKVFELHSCASAY